MMVGKVRKETLLAIAVLVLTLSLGASFFRTFDKGILRDETFRENPLWVTAQAQYELQRLTMALNRFGNGDARYGVDDIRLQFDILWSRIDLLKIDNSQSRLLSRSPEVVQAAAAATHLLARLEPDIQALTAADRAGARRLAESFDLLAPPLRDATLAVNTAQALNRAEGRAKVREELWLAALLALGVVSAGAVLLVVAVRETRNSRRLAQRNAAAVRELAQARDELETRVTERTASLTAEVAERRRKESELRDSEDRYRRVVETVPDAIWIHRNGIVLYANQACAGLLGVASPDELIGRNALEFVHEHDLGLARGRMSQAMAGKAVPVREIRMLSSSGKTVPAEVAVTPTAFEGEAALMTVLRDVSERREAEAALRRSEARLNQALEASGDGLWDWDIKADTVRRSLGSAAILGSAPDDIGVRADDWHARIHPDDLAEHGARIRACLVGDTPGFTAEYRLRTVSGDWVWVQSRGKVVEWDDKGAPVRMVGTVRDMTDRRRNEEDLRALKEAAEGANAAKNRFLAHMSHELRTPLNAILGFSDAMRMELAGPIGNKVYKDYVDDIHRSGAHLLDLISDLLDISAIESGVFKLNETTIDVPTLVSGCLRLMKPKADASGIMLRDGGFDIGTAVAAPALRADERRVRQVLLNALAGGMRRTPEGGHVTLSAMIDDEGGLVFSVADDGVSMTETEIARTLDVLLPAVGDPMVPGVAGVGLPLSRTLTQAHGGTLEIDGTGGAGTVTNVRFPPSRVLHRGGEQGATLRLV